MKWYSPGVTKCRNKRSCEKGSRLDQCLQSTKHNSTVLMLLAVGDTMIDHGYLHRKCVQASNDMQNDITQSL